MPEDTPPESGSSDCGTNPGDRDVLHSAVPAGLTLDSLIELTDELGHLNELVMIHLAQEGGFTGERSYFTIVTPILDELEIVIRHQYRPGMSRNEIKLVIQDWIDREIAELR
jgi:hypothetical protein